MKTSKLIFFFLLLARLSFSQTNTWTGSSSTDWHSGCNWSLGHVPTCTENVVIPNSTTNKPTITGVASCLTIDIQGTTSTLLTIATGGLLQVDQCPVANTINASGKIIFVTAAAMPAVTTVANRDLQCQNEATAAGLSGTYKAWIYNSGSNNISSSGGTCGYRKVNGTVVATSWADLTDGTLSSAIDMQANGTSGIADLVFTGLNYDGTVSTRHCTNWTSQTATGTYGYSWVTNTNWSSAGYDECRETNTSTTFTLKEECTGGAQPDYCVLCSAWPRYDANWTSYATQKNANSACAAVSTFWADRCGIISTTTTYSTLSRRHYCFQQ